MCAQYMHRDLPSELQPLAELSLDMRFAECEFAMRIWQSLDPEAWERSKNPYMILRHARRSNLEAAAANESLKKEMQQWFEYRRRYLERPGWFGEHHSDSPLRNVGYFSMEFGLGESLPIYSGGLGILAGDHLKSASDLGVPVVGIGLLYQQGYFRQVLAQDGWQLQAFPFNDPSILPVTPVIDEGGRWPRVRLPLPGRTLFLRVWQVHVGKVKLYLLDSNHPLNSPWDRGITASLYAAGSDKRLLQEIVLGVGGWRLLEKLGIEVQVCHLNEGHAAFAVLARAKSFAEKHGVDFRTALRATRAGNVFTTHTPVEAAFDKFEPSMLAKYGQPLIEEIGLPLEEILALGRGNAADRNEPFNMAYLAMRGSCHVNGVSRLHGSVSRRLFRTLFPGTPETEVPVGHITNGVHIPTWESGQSYELWSRAYSGAGSWLSNMEEASRALESLTDEKLWDFRAAARKTLIDYVRQRYQRQCVESGAPEGVIQQSRHVLDPNVFTLGFARRFTSYKRPNLVLHDPARFAAILLNNDRPVQFIIAGKAHPKDEEGKAMVQAMAQFSRRDELRERMVFLEDYDITLARHLAAGIDVWLNTPRRPAEACGTSGMKMLVNGGLHFSTLDGWWDEAYREDLGWALGDAQEHRPDHDAHDALEFYDILEQKILPEFYDRNHDGVPRKWIARIRTSMTSLTAQFSSDRMVRDYVDSAYLPAATAYLKRAANQATVAKEIDDWQQNISDGWQETRFGELWVESQNGQYHLELQIYLGDLPPQAVEVEVFADACDGHQSRRVAMMLDRPIHGAVNGFVYQATIPNDRPLDHFTPRLLPSHPNAFVPLEQSSIRWM